MTRLTRGHAWYLRLQDLTTRHRTRQVGMYTVTPELIHNRLGTFHADHVPFFHEA